MNYYRLHIGDYLRDTAHLSLLEHGVYARLLQVYYTREGSIGESERYRVVGARTPDEREAVDAVLAEFFTLVDGEYTQSRCDREIADYQSKAERNREVGRLGGRPVASKNPQETQTVSTQNPDETLASSHKPRERDTHTPRASAVDLAVAMRQAGIDANSAHPEVLALAEQGLSVETVVAACEEVRRRKPGERVPVGYVAKVLESWARRAAETRANGAQAPPRGPPKPATKAESFVAKLNGSQPPPEVVDVIAAAESPRRLGA